MGSESESFVRWQDTTISQLTYVVNLILTLSTASLGFAVSLIVNKDFDPSPSFWGKRFFILTIVSLLVSTGLGIWCVINRLIDFRISKRVARKEEESDEVVKLRLRTKKYGCRTWKIFWWQIGVFALSVLSFVVSIIFIYSQKLF